MPKGGNRLDYIHLSNHHYVMHHMFCEKFVSFLILLGLHLLSFTHNAYGTRGGMLGRQSMEVTELTHAHSS